MQAVGHREPKLRMIRAFFALILALSLSFGVLPAQAQSIDPAATELKAETANNALETLLEVLKDDTARTKLIEELEATVANAEEAADGRS